MMKELKTWTVLVLFAIAAAFSSCTQQSGMKALILTGQNNHNWQKSSLYLKDILEKTDLFTVEIRVSPESGKDMSEFVIDFKNYDLIVLDYNGDSWPDETQTNFVNYVRDGGGVVVYHAADNAFPDWAEYNEIIGLGGWEGRNEDSGPYVYVVDGEVVKDSSPGRGGSHGQQHEFAVQAFQPAHPILKGLPEKWLHAKDELYSELRGPAKNLEVLSYSFADEKYGGTGRNEPVLMTVSYGKGRVFHTVLGHAGNGNFFPAMECAGFVVTLQRGAEWAATGKVKQKLPESFPTENQSLQWEYFEDAQDGITPFLSRLEKYETGKSYEAFNLLRKLVAENSSNEQKMAEYHQLILKLLNSSKATVECKKVLLKEFSWMANDEYIPVFEQLRQNPELADYAQFALDRMKVE